MNEAIKIFDSVEFGSIRTAKIDNQIFFVGKDIADALGYANSRKALGDHVDEFDKCKRDDVTIRDSMGRMQVPTLINESGLYSLILSSKLEAARRFKRWITSDVIPTIRKTGSYSVDIPQTLPDALRAYADEVEAHNMAKALIEEQRPKVLFADVVSGSDTSILVGELAKILRQKGIDIGQNRLFERLRQEDFLIKGGSSRNMPTQKAMDLGLFEIKESTVLNPDGSLRVTKTPKVTGKGQIYFINRFLGN